MRSLRPWSIARIILGAIVLFAAIEMASSFMLQSFYDRRFPEAIIATDRYGTSNGLTPGASATVWGKDFHSDALGGRSTGQEVSDSSYYWLYLGDSVGEGVGVDDSSCAVSRTARSVKDMRLVNLAHIGHSTCDEWNVLRAWTDTCSRVRRVTVLYALNDVYGKASTQQLPQVCGTEPLFETRRWLERNIAIYRLLKLFLLQGSDNYFRFDEQFYREDDTHFAEAMGCLDTIAARCHERGITLEVVMLPYRSQVEASTEVEQVPQRMVGAHCRGAAIPFTDALPAFRAANDAGGLFLFADEIHLSDEGNEVLAEVLMSR